MAKLTIRDRVSRAFLLAACVTAPRYIRPILANMLEGIEGLAEQLASGREGGVMVTPWYISEAGSDLAHEQERQCCLVAGQVRAALSQKEQSDEG